MTFDQLTAALILPILTLPNLLRADTIVQNGMVSGGPEPTTQDVFIDQFDTQGGTRQLNYIQLDFLTSMIGGYQTNGSAIPVHIFAQLDGNWSLNGTPLANTQALIDTIVPNITEGSATVFNTDTEQVILSSPSEMVPWVGAGQLAMQVFTQFQISEDPAEIIFFDAGGSVRYTVTYDFAVVPAPGALALLIAGAVRRSRRR